ncbi:Aste57867_24167 [Aphanomyces stellatus]|uniref:Aste57867_24167 protein n=1 Tax=Aphanomyces stellatus TaxID=120398 RepID=A0A485LU08_9STRA|nr:hypothetical protein As57867_024093 [Aphanomyces stellatus]VFU00809.1 Aste57867_24167 [Aphanomyces stellatus]
MGGHNQKKQKPVQLTTIKNVSTRNIEALRDNALRLVSEGYVRVHQALFRHRIGSVVELEEEAHAAYERQGNMAYYSEDNLARRLAIRDHPLLRRLTCALWRLVCHATAPMDVDGYGELMIRLHKILVEHFDANASYIQIKVQDPRDVLLRVAACCCVLLRVATCGYVWLRVAACCCVWLHVATCGYVLLRVAACCYVWLRVATCGYVWLRVATCGYVWLRDDWESDTKGEACLTYNNFHLSMFELVDLWCDSIQAEDYVSLLYLILEGITRSEQCRFVLRDLKDVLYTDVVDAALKRSMMDIEAILATMLEEPIMPPTILNMQVGQALEMTKASTTAAEISPASHHRAKTPPRDTSFSAKEPAMTALPATFTSSPQSPKKSPKSKHDKTPPKQRKSTRSVSQVQVSVPGKASSSTTTSTKHDARSESFASAAVMALSDETTSPHTPLPNPRLRLDSPVRTDHDDDLSTALSPWDDSAPPILLAAPTPSSSIAKLPASSSVKATPVTRASQAQLPDLSPSTAVPPGRLARPSAKEPMPLETREFGGFSIMSSKDVNTSMSATNGASPTVFKPNAPSENGSKGVGLGVGNFQDTPSEERIAEIRRAFQDQKRQSFVRKRTPPTLAIVDKPPLIVEADDDNDGAMQPPETPVKGKARARLLSQIRKESVELVTALASTLTGDKPHAESNQPASTKPPSGTTGAMIHRPSLAAALASPRPSIDYGVVQLAINSAPLGTPSKGGPQGNDDDAMLSPHALLHIGLQDLPRPTGAPKHRVPRRLRHDLKSPLADTAMSPNDDATTPGGDMLTVHKLTSPRYPDPAVAHTPKRSTMRPTFISQQHEDVDCATHPSPPHGMQLPPMMQSAVTFAISITSHTVTPATSSPATHCAIRHRQPADGESLEKIADGTKLPSLKRTLGQATHQPHSHEQLHHHRGDDRKARVEETIKLSVKAVGPPSQQTQPPRPPHGNGRLSTMRPVMPSHRSSPKKGLKGVPGGVRLVHPPQPKPRCDDASPVTKH